jgi:hypothetical protein
MVAIFGAPGHGGDGRVGHPKGTMSARKGIQTWPR